MRACFAEWLRPSKGKRNRVPHFWPMLPEVGFRIEIFSTYPSL